MIGVVRTFPWVSCFAIQAATTRRVCNWRVETVKVPVQGTVVAGYDEAATRRSSAGEAQNGITLSVYRPLEVGLLIIAHTTFRAIFTGQFTRRMSEGNVLSANSPGSWHRRINVFAVFSSSHTFKILPDILW